MYLAGDYETYFKVELKNFNALEPWLNSYPGMDFAGLSGK